jgi:hypothetical protein
MFAFDWSTWRRAALGVDIHRHKSPIVGTLGVRNIPDSGTGLSGRSHLKSAMIEGKRRDRRGEQRAGTWRTSMIMVFPETAQIRGEEIGEIRPMTSQAALMARRLLVNTKCFFKWEVPFSRQFVPTWKRVSLEKCSSHSQIG